MLDRILRRRSGRTGRDVGRKLIGAILAHFPDQGAQIARTMVAATDPDIAGFLKAMVFAGGAHRAREGALAMPRSAARHAPAKAIKPKRPDGRTLRARPRAAGSASRSGSLRQAAILDAGALLMPQRGFVGTTVEDVTDQLDLTRAAFYSYVENKEELLPDLDADPRVRRPEHLRDRTLERGPEPEACREDRLIRAARDGPARVLHGVLPRERPPRRRASQGRDAD